MSNPPHQPITREALAAGTIQQMVQERDGEDHGMLDEAELKASRRSMVGDDNTDDIWLFAYGSLIWNPALEIAATQPGGFTAIAAVSACGR